MCEVHKFSSVQSLSRVRLFATPWIAACQASLSITNSQSSLRLMPIESVMPSSHLILSRPLLPLPPMPPSIRVLYILNAQLMFSYYFHFEVTCGCSHQKTNRCLKRSVFCFIQPNHLNSDSENNLKTIEKWVFWNMREDRATTVNKTNKIIVIYQCKCYSILIIYIHNVI